MLRTLVFALALGLPTLAAAEAFPQSALHAEVRSDEGTVMSRVESVERDSQGRIVAIEAPGLEPADAPADGDLVAANDPRNARYVLASYDSAERNHNAMLSAGGGTARTR